MKKIILISLLLVALLFAGCGKDKKTTSPTSIDPYSLENVTYSLMIANIGLTKGTYGVMLDSYGNAAALNTAEVSINGVNVPLESYQYDNFISWYGNVELDQGSTAHCVANLNGTSYTFDLNIPYSPIVDWPETINPASGFPVNWTLAQNSENQYFEAVAYSNTTDDDDEKYEELSVSARSFDVPANWINANLDEYSYAVSEFSYKVNGTVLADAIDGSIVQYGGAKADTGDYKNLARRISARILNK